MAVVGFDVGDQTSLFAVPRGGGIDVLLNDYSQRQTPTIVAFGERQRAIGDGGKLKMVTGFENTIAGFKNLLGRQYDDADVQEALKTCFFRHLKLEDGTVGVRVTHGGKEEVLSLVQIMGMLLAFLKGCTEKELGTKLVDCVISVPVYFNDEQRHALLNSSRIAGLRCLKLMNETAAVALAYGIYKSDLPEESAKPRRVVFCDFGHTSLQLCLCEFVKGKLKVLVSEGVPLGGRDFTLAIVDVMAQRFKEKSKQDVKKLPRAFIRLEAECEKLKKLMSSNNQELPLNLECLVDERDFNSAMGRAEFDKLCEPLLNRVRNLIDAFLASIKAKDIPVSEIDAVEIVGGSTRVPAIREMLSAAFGNVPLSTTLNADEAVSRGCALMGAMLSPTFRVREFKVEDAVPYSINLHYTKEDGEGNMMEPIYTAHSRAQLAKVLSFRRSKPFEVQAHYAQPEVVLGGNRQIGNFRIDGVHPSFDNEAQTVKVKVKLDTHGCFFVDSAQMNDKLPPSETDQQASEAGTPASTAPGADTGASAESAGTPMDTSDEDKASAAGADGQAGTEAQATPEAAAADGTTPMDTTPDSKAAAEQVRKKAKTHRIEALSVSMEKPGLISDQQMNLLVEKENEFAAQDRRERERADARNALEEFIYDMRDKISSVYEEFIKPDDSETYRAKLQSAEDWLYEDDADDRPKKVYLDKLSELQTTGNEVKRLKTEHDIRPRSEDNLRQLIVRYRKFLTEHSVGDAKYAHISNEEVSKVAESVEKHESWINSKSAEQAKRPKFEPPVVTVAEIEAAKNDLERTCNKIVTKPVPKAEPPKEEPKPAQAAPGAGAESGPAPPPPAPEAEGKTQEPQGMELD